MSILVLALVGWVVGLDVSGGDPVLSHGFDALRGNPAGLVASDNPRATLKYFEFQGRAGSSGPTLGDVQRYFLRPAHLSSEDKALILGRLDGKPLRLEVSGMAELFSLQYRSWGFGIDYEHLNCLSVPRDGLDLVLNGNELNRRYSLAGLGAETLSLWRVRFARGIRLGRAGLGVALAGLVGTHCCRTVVSEGELLTSEYAIAGWSREVQQRASGGYGCALSLGGSWDLHPNWRVGFAARDLANRVWWVTETGTREITRTLDSLDIERYRQRPKLDSFLHTRAQFVSGGGFQTDQPGTLAAGVLFQAGELLRTSLGVNFGFGTDPFRQAEAIPLVVTQVQLRLFRTIGLGLKAGWSPGPERWYSQASLGFQHNGLVGTLGASLQGASLDMARRVRVGLNLGYEFAEAEDD